MAAAEAEVGAAFGQVDAADRLAFRIEDPHAVESRFAHAPADPQVAVDIDAQAVGRAVGLGRDERPHVGELRAVLDHVVRRGSRAA